MGCNIWRDCKRVPITELLSFIVDNRGKTVPTAPSGHKLIATNCVTNDTLFPVYEKIRYLSEETYQTWFRAHPLPGDILFVNKGTPGRVCLVPDPVDFCIAQDMIALRVDDTKIYNKYLFAVLRSREIQQQIYNTNVGDVIPHFKKQFMNQLLIPVPEREIQETIGDLYYLLSFKIEHNKKINENLEKQAQALFNRWFVDFEFPNEEGKPYRSSGGKMVESEMGMIPEGWEIRILGDMVDTHGGYSYKGDELQPSKNALATIKNFNRNGGLRIDGFKEIIPLKNVKPAHYLSLYDVLVAHTDLTQAADVLGNCELLLTKLDYEEIIYSMDLVKVTPKIPELNNFVLAQILSDKRFKNHALGYRNGTTVLHLSKKAVPDYELPVPNNLVLFEKLGDLLRPLYMQISCNIALNRKLVELRDSLLPKLMNGSIEINV